MVACSSSAPVRHGMPTRGRRASLCRVSVGDIEQQIVAFAPNSSNRSTAMRTDPPSLSRTSTALRMPAGCERCIHFARIDFLNRSVNVTHDRGGLAFGAQHDRHGIGHERHELLGKLHKRVVELCLDGRFRVGIESPLPQTTPTISAVILLAPRCGVNQGTIEDGRIYAWFICGVIGWGRSNIRSRGTAMRLFGASSRELSKRRRQTRFAAVRRGRGVAAAVVLLCGLATSRAAESYHLLKKYNFPAAEGSTREYFDYITVDSRARRVY